MISTIISRVLARWLVSGLLLATNTPQEGSTQQVGAPCAETPAVRRDAPRQQGADPLGAGPWYINADGTIWALKQPWRPGIFLKTAWIKPLGSMISITGRRLDAEAPPLWTGKYSRGARTTLTAFVWGTLGWVDVF